MTSAPKGSGVVVATSFPLKLVRTNAARLMEDYDRLCIASWIACGFRILSLNNPEEIPALAARYPEVEFVPSGRNASTRFGRNTPFIADILSLLAGTSASVLGIINSDLLFQPHSAWQHLDSIIGAKAVVTGQRYDVRSLAGGALHLYLPGFDYFFFSRAAAEDLSTDTGPFSIGLPWWDYWFPLTMAARGYDIQCVVRPAVLHLAHGSQTDARSANWRQLAIEFARSMVAESTGRTLPPNWQDLLALCRDLIAAPEGAMEKGDLDERIIRLSEHSVPLIAGKLVEFDDSAPDESRATLLPALFDDIPNRVTAGHALHQALWEEKQEQFDIAARLYSTAVNRAPSDPGVLSACGNFLFRRGDYGRAAMLLEKAVERAPHSAMLLNSLGSALAQLGRTEASIRCFERAVESEPSDGMSWYNLAMALYPFGRHRALIARLENRLTQTPPFPDGPEWLARIRDSLAEIEGAGTGAQHGYGPLKS